MSDDASTKSGSVPASFYGDDVFINCWHEDLHKLREKQSRFLWCLSAEFEDSPTSIGQWISRKLWMHAVRIWPWPHRDA